MKTALLASLLACIAITPNWSRGAGRTDPVNGLQMSIAPAQLSTASQQATQFIIGFTNESRTDLTFAPGTLISCAVRPSKTSAIVLNLTDPQGKQHHRMPYLGDGPPYQGGCGGQIELFIVTLHPHESIPLPLDISKYFDLTDAKQYEGARFPAGAYSVEAEFNSTSYPIQNSKVAWSGTVKSNPIQVRFNSEFSALLDDFPR